LTDGVEELRVALSMVSLAKLEVEGSLAETLERIPLKPERYQKVPSFSMIVPIYNEAAILPKSLDTLGSFLEGKECELILYDDSSTDGTCVQLRTFAHRIRDPQTLLVRSDARIGKGASIKSAARKARGRTIIIMDADLSADLRCIPEMVRQASASGGIVIGQRSTSDRVTHGPLRVVLSLGYNVLARLLFHTGVWDHQCGLKAINADVAEKLLDNVKNDAYVFDTELIVLARKLKIPIRQVKVRWVDGHERKSNLRWIRTGLTMMRDLFALKASGI
jgi:glycosyltransferase involved in cell wall biosynthesis